MIPHPVLTSLNLPHSQVNTNRLISRELPPIMTATALTLFQHALCDGLGDLSGANEAHTTVAQANRVGDATLDRQIPSCCRLAFTGEPT